jgi:hypothetical protein
VIEQLQQIINDSLDENKFQELLAGAPWLIEPSWTVITQNQSLKNFKQAFEQYWKKTHSEDITLAIEHQSKRPDFTLISIDGFLHIVEIKKAGHDFNDKDFERLINYVSAFEDFFVKNTQIAGDFKGWRIDLVADGENIIQPSNKYALEGVKQKGQLIRVTWQDFLHRAKKVHEKFLEVHDYARANPKGVSK